MCPGNEESAGKRRSGKTSKGSKWLRSALTESARAAARAKGTYLAAHYARLRGRPEVLTAPFVLGDQEKVIYLFKAAGIDEVAVELHQGTMTFPSIEVFVETEVKGSPLENRIDEESYRGVIKEAEDKLQRFVVEDGVVMPMDAFIITAEES